MLAERECPLAIEPPPTAARVLWGIRFRAPLLNAAGMFKHGEGYELAYRQGAGAYLAGTTTARPRLGNVRRGIAQPFVPYPRSRAASNWLGLPNPGHRAVAARIAQLPRYEGFPIGASVALDPGDDSAAALERLVEGMSRYADAGVDFFELNESCPNTGEDQRGFDTLGVRLEAIAPASRSAILRFATKSIVPRSPQLNVGRTPTSRAPSVGVSVESRCGQACSVW
jgi:dihydroorotate dehydrogenase